MTVTDNYGTAEWQALDREHHLHPFTDTKALNAKGTRIITRADGVYLWDSEGNRLIDAMAGLWCVNVGYGREELADAAYRQMRELAYYNTFFHTTHPPAAELAALLAEVTPSHLNQAFFTGSGSESTDTVVRLVRRYWQIAREPSRQVIISRHNAYHGSTIAALSLGGMQPMHQQAGVLLPGVEHITEPYWYKLGGGQSPEAFGLGAARALEEKIESVGPKKVAAFIAEPVQGAGGVIVPPETYWPEIVRICEHYGILLVVDEVICGFGRTGNWFGCDYFDLPADLMSTAKGLSSGYLPIGAVMVGDRVAELLVDKGGEFQHGFTYSGHPVACAVAAANIRILQREDIVHRVATQSAPYFQARLRELEDHPLVGEARGIGMLGALQLAKDKATRALFQPEGDVGMLCRDHCFENGLVMRAVQDSMVLAPALVITRAQIDEIMDLVRHCLDLTARDIGL